MCACTHKYKYAYIKKKIHKNKLTEEPNTYPGKGQNMCGEVVKWSELKLEVRIDQGDCLPESLGADLISKNSEKMPS